RSLPLMDCKNILLCLMVLLLLGNSTHAECELHVAFTGPACIALTCQYACQSSWGDHSKQAYCVSVNVATWNCSCNVCKWS
uniref:Uncharacterized protein n=1 Tax=Aegilops tauschii subsp. strangulata TaxID=200361 RepID=A0A453GXV8_AEGTS